MPLIPPKLDDRDFESLFEEARSRIPRYLPEWTDWNPSDPGITMLQLHAWLTETILFRLNQLPDLNYIKYLQLLGIEQEPAKPARAELSFTLKASLEAGNVAEVLIAKGTVIGSSERDLPEPVNFETDRTLRAITARLEFLLRDDGSGIVGSVDDVTQDNTAPDSRFHPFGLPSATGTSLVLGFRSDQPFPRNEIGLQIYLPQKGQEILASPEATMCGPEIEDPNSPQTAWEWWDGTEWSALIINEDGSRNLTRSGQVYFQVPGQIPQALPNGLGTGFQEIGDGQTLYYWLRIRYVSGNYLDAPEIESLLTNTVTATAALTVSDEAVSSSDGTPNQKMLLRHSPVLADPPLELEVDEGQGSVAWTQVDDFHDGGPQDEYYVLNRSTGEITFGDGLRGRIPIAGQFNVVARQYRYGGGQVSNVGANTITDMVTTNADVDEVTNYRAAADGADEQSLDEAKTVGPRKLLRTRDRAVTLEDFAELAKEAPGAMVARAYTYAEQDQNDSASVVHVVVVPQSADAKPVPSEATRELVCRYLDRRRLVTTQVRVMGPPYHDMRVELSVRARDDADLKAVKNSISARLTTYFQPLEGGSDGNGWPFGRDVYYSEVLHEVMSLDGVLLVENLKLRKLLPRGGGANQPYFDTQAEAESNKTSLLQTEQDAFSDLPEGCEPEGDVVRVVVPSDDDETPPEERWYVAAVYDCCDMPVEEGALVALQQTPDITVNYLRARGA